MIGKAEQSGIVKGYAAGNIFFSAGGCGRTS